MTGQWFARALMGLCFGFSVASVVQAQPNELTWPRTYYDPAPQTAADLVLPMPCGGAMAFQKVVVPLDVENPLSDRRVLLGRSENQTGYADYFRQAFLRGGFEDAEGQNHFFIARYELTAGQARALQGDCAEPTRADRLAHSDVSWFDAVELSSRYSSWLLQNAKNVLPKAGDGFAFVRLPTEVEWEFAVRGGVKVDAATLAQTTFFPENANLEDYALILSEGSGRTKPGAVGLRLPNPLGLFDVYGNAEEIMLEPFRLNALGRDHGQVGGIVTRGASVLSSTEEVYSAQRVEYPPFSAQTGMPLKSETFGLRFVLSSVVTNSDEKVRRLQSDWIELARAAESEIGDFDPLAELARLAEEELDPRRKGAFAELQHALQLARGNETTSQIQSAKSAWLAGAVLVEAVRDNETRLRTKIANIRMLVSLRKSGGDVEGARDLIGPQLQSHTKQLADLRRLRTSYLLSLRSVLILLGEDLRQATRDSAFELLETELSQSEQTQILDHLHRFAEDFEAFEQQGDLAMPDLLSEVLR